MPMPKINTGKLSLYYEEHGAGDPLLLIAGLGSDHSSWLGIVPKLSEYFRVIIFDNRGCGRSDIPAEAYAVRDMAGDTIRLLDRLKIKQTHIIGHSMGGYISQELAINHPERIGKLILANTAAVSSQRNNSLFREISEQLGREGHSEAWIKRWAYWLFSPNAFDDSAFIDVFVKNSLQYPYLQSRAGFQGQIEAIAQFDTRDKLSKIQSKTLVIAGKEDILITPGEAETFAGHIPTSIFQLFDNLAHCIQMEKPELFVDAVLAFLGTKQ